MNKNIAKPLPLPVNITLNQEGNQAILHINCQSDGNKGKWIKNKEESSEQAKRVWLGKLGCQLVIHQEVEYILNNPWDYKIADFPKNYKLFVVERKAEGKKPPRTDHYLCGGVQKYRSPQEFYPHMHWLLDNAQGVRKPCICQYCDPSRSQEEINAIFPLPPHKESPKGPVGPKEHKRTRKPQGPRGVTSQRGMVMNRNSITTGPVASLENSGEKLKVIGYKTSHPFRS